MHPGPLDRAPWQNASGRRRTAGHRHSPDSLLLASCLTVWVKAEPEEHMKRVLAQGDIRPMANSSRAMEDLVSILRSREPLYAKAEILLSTSGRTPEQAVSELLRLIEVPDTRMSRQHSVSPTLDKEKV